MFKRLLGLSLIFGMAATAPPANAASCGLRDSVIEQLQRKYAEELTVGGLQQRRGQQSVMEIWASPETGTFTVLLTQANGISCIVAAGTDFFQAIPKQAVEDTPS
ncbi:hypothetical protein SAMN05444007_104386 [Cribrihabitans marinus]|uniref:Lipoprotein n=1 Tax=Cribrihabitans marinus TaxID=1227549 RepID=A0A1H6YIX3_9RHOB|nr:hypothetical protein [Cribrihabitans marinus]GGH29330.1 hypothetical protein GCM10010973_18780 [Cribrihabitans marinus]SEJ41268.1 hypothetical protein SAMN05444007_104386 [Cribrihabitans marinus]